MTSSDTHTNTYSCPVPRFHGENQIIQADRRTTSLPPHPKPMWEPFYMEQPGDGQGELLVSVQLINTKSSDLPEPEDITPKTRAVRS